MLKGYMSSDSDSDLDDLDDFYSEPPVKVEREPRPLPPTTNDKLREKLDSAMKEDEKINLFLTSADKGDLATLEELISLGVSVDCSRKQEWTPLLKACAAGNFEVVQFLLEHGSNPNLHKELLTPLMVCCSYSLTPGHAKLNCVRLLLQHGADVNLKDKYRTTALMYACENGYEDIVTELLAVPNININMQDKEGFNALFYAVYSNNQSLVQKLVEAGIDLTLKDRYERTALMLALENGQQEIAKLLGYTEEEEEERSFQKEELEANYRFLKQLPDAHGKGGFNLDVKHILSSLGLKNVKDISFPDFLNITDEGLYDIGVKLKPYRQKILFLIHHFHLRPWTKHSIHRIELGMPLCIEDVIAITGDLAKHLTLANASLQYIDSRLTSRLGKECNNKITEKDLINTLTDMYQTAERLTLILSKINNYVNQMEPEVVDDYIYPLKGKKKNKLSNCLWCGCGITAIGLLLNVFWPEVINDIKYMILPSKVLGNSLLRL